MDESEVIPAKRRKTEDNSEGEKKAENRAESSEIAEKEGSKSRKVPFKSDLQIKLSVIDRLRKISSKTGLFSSAKKNIEVTDVGERKDDESLGNGERDTNQNVEKGEVKISKTLESNDDVTSTNHVKRTSDVTYDVKTSGDVTDDVTKSGDAMETDDVVKSDVTKTDDVIKSDDVIDGDDVIISSTGSSPAHSPKPEDLTMLSTPPKRGRLPEAVLANQIKALEKVSSKLTDRFDRPVTTGSPVFATSSKADEDEAENEVDRSKTGGSDAEERRNEAAGDEADTSLKIVEPSLENGAKGVEEPAEETRRSDRGHGSSPETSFESTTEGRPTPLNFNSNEFKALLKQMIDDKFKQIESAYESKNPEGELRMRILRLEEENADLQEYAGKLEKAVKLLLANQESKPEKVCRAAQTDVSITVHDIAASVKTPVEVTAQVPHRTPTSLQLNTPSTEMTSRLTSTVASIPGHSVTPSSLPQQVHYPRQQAPHPTSSSTARQYPPQRPQIQYTTQVHQVRAGVAAQNPTVVNRPAPVTATVRPQTVSPPNVVVSGGVTYRPPLSYTNTVQKTVYVNGKWQLATLPTAALPNQQVQQRVVVGSQPGTVLITRPPTLAQQIPRQQPPQYQQQAPSMVTRPPPVARPPQMPGLPPPQRPPQMVPGVSPPEYRPAQPQVGPPAPVPQGAPTVYPPGTLQKDPPPRPTVSIAVVSNGIVLSWNMQSAANMAQIVRYQLYALQDVGPNGAPAQWKKIGVVNALPLPMACTLTQFMSGNKYHFAVRAMDEFGRSGPFSEPCTITLK